MPVTVVVEPGEDGRGAVVAANFRWEEEENRKLFGDALEAFRKITDQIRVAQQELIEMKTIRVDLVQMMAELPHPVTGEKMTKAELGELLGVSRQRVEQILRHKKKASHDNTAPNDCP